MKENSRLSKIHFICLLTLVLFLMSNKMTVMPGTASGNGNPALLIVLILIPLMILMVTLWIRIMKIQFIKVKFLIVGMVLIVIHWIIAFIYQMREFEDYKEVIKNALLERNGVVSAEYLDDITSIFSLNVNNQYFNLNTFFMFLTLSIFIAAFFCIWDRLEESHTKSQNS